MVLDYLKSLPFCKAIKTITNNQKGVSDILCCLQGTFIAIEVKAPNKPTWKHTTKLQKKYLREVNDALGFGFSTNDFDHFKKCLDLIIL